MIDFRAAIFGNKNINTILNYQIALCKRNHIEMQIEVNNIPDLSISPAKNPPVHAKIHVLEELVARIFSRKTTCLYLEIF